MGDKKQFCSALTDFSNAFTTREQYLNCQCFILTKEILGSSLKSFLASKSYKNCTRWQQNYLESNFLACKIFLGIQFQHSFLRHFLANLANLTGWIITQNERILHISRLTVRQRPTKIFRCLNHGHLHIWTELPHEALVWDQNYNPGQKCFFRRWIKNYSLGHLYSYVSYNSTSQYDRKT